mmetsp:Transcript_14948/g.31187  ORF Transcript_14948/g.31187 Transcript_14948/m.31187 type:complete len:270 (-) Transcript_14948:356-1165(-)
MFWHCGMWRSAACCENLRPQWGHGTRSSSSSASCGMSTVRRSLPAFWAAVTARADAMAWRSCADSCFHLAFLGAALAAGFLPPLAVEPFTYLAASVPCTRCACTSMGLRFCTNTLVHTLACLASASLVNERLHDLHTTSGAGSAASSSGGTAEKLLALATGMLSIASAAVVGRLAPALELGRAVAGGLAPVAGGLPAAVPGFFLLASAFRASARDGGGLAPGLAPVGGGLDAAVLGLPAVDGGRGPADDPAREPGRTGAGRAPAPVLGV